MIKIIHNALDGQITEIISDSSQYIYEWVTNLDAAYPAGQFEYSIMENCKNSGTNGKAFTSNRTQKEFSHV